jgi:hypothetical protein
MGGPFDVGIADTGADRDTTGLVSVDDAVQPDRSDEIVIEFGKGMN